jgi:adenylate cyclase
LISLAPPGVWLAATAVIVTLAWGIIDPFGVRKRLDWLLEDQLLRSRSAPTMHPDLVQISIDERASDQIGLPLPRSEVARVLRQLNRLGARTVLVDVLFAGPGSTSPAVDEARRQLVPLQLNDTSLYEPFLEDNLLAASMAALDRLVIPFNLRRPELDVASAGDLLRRMSHALANDPRLTAEQLAGRLGAPGDVVSRLFDRALAGTLDQYAHRALQERPADDPLQSLAESLPGVQSESYLGTEYLKALDRVRTQAVFQHKAGFTAPQNSERSAFRGLVTDSPQLPRFAFVSAARMLGFMDADIDFDGTVRRLPLVARESGSFYVHQALAATALHLNVALDGASLGDRLIRVTGVETRIPVDKRGCLTINWPMTGRRNWDTVIPQISVVDLVKLDGYEFDLRFARNELRNCMAGLDQHASGGGVGLALQFQDLAAAYAAGDVERAVAIERDFDAGRDELMKLPDVRAAIEKQRNEPAVADDPDAPPIEQWARAYVRISEQLPPLQREQHDAFEALRTRIAGKFCLMGDTTTGSVDLKRTPVAAAVPGISVIAAAANTMLTGRYLTNAGFGWSAVLMLVASALVAFVSLRFNALPAGAAAVATIAVTLIGCVAALHFASLLLSPVTPVLGLICTYTTVTTYRWWDEFQQKKLVRTIFETQTNATIVDRLIRAGAAGVEEVLTPKNRLVTVFFGQIVDYNEMADKLEPDRMASLLSRVFGTMAKVILQQDGTLDRYEGHAMMAFFGAPVYQPDHAERACRAALGCREAVHQLATDPTLAGLPPLRVHFGIHTGELLVGNITLTSRVDYTVAGENLSVAYRVADLNETYGSEIMITHATLQRCDSTMDTRELDAVRIKGRRDPVRAYELIATKGQSPPEKVRLISAFVTGLTAFRNRDYPAALSMFRACHADSPTDRATGVYIERCEKGIASSTQGDLSTAE